MRDRFIRNVYNVEEIFRVMKTGVTSPIECRLDNGQQVILKYPKNRAGSQVLPNELIGYSIADYIDVNIPYYGICRLSDTIIDNAVDQLGDEELDICDKNTGLCFYTHTIGNNVPLMMDLVSYADCLEVEKVILLDYIVSNYDRHDGNVLFSLPEKKAYIIDFSHIITKAPALLDRDYEMLRNDKSVLSASTFLENRHVYDLLSLRGFDDDYFVKLSIELQDILTVQVIESIFDRIPYEWKDYWKKENLERMKAIINLRISSLEKVAALIIKERK